jgi:hypothetical protein
MQSPQYKESGAIYLSGTEGVTIRGNRLMYLEGNGIYLSGYNRGTNVVDSELTMIGDSPIALWGYTESSDPLLPPGTGVDGSAGNQPRGTVVEGNLCHEYGFHQKVCNTL